MICWQYHPWEILGCRRSFAVGDKRRQKRVESDGNAESIIKNLLQIYQQRKTLMVFTSIIAFP